MENGIKTGILTISTKGAAGLRDDESGDTVQRMLEEQGFNVVRRHIIPDRLQEIADTLVAWVDEDNLALIVTSGAPV